MIKLDDGLNILACVDQQDWPTSGLASGSASGDNILWPDIGGCAAKQIAIIGSIGAQYWPHFSVSDEYRDGKPNPLDRWSRRIITQWAKTIGGVALFPFDGPPYWPFQRWAVAGGQYSPSPLGLLIHHQYGLWSAFRGAVALSQAGHVRDFGKSRFSASPCDTCDDKPCLQSCPVSAFDASGYDVDKCRGHLRQNLRAACHTKSCLARVACPVGRENAYGVAPAQFHMQAFVGP